MRIVQSILEAEWIPSFRQFAELHAVDDRDIRQVVMRLAGEFQHLLQAFIIPGIERQGDMHVRCADGMLPVFWRIGSEVMRFARSLGSLPHADSRPNLRSRPYSCIREIPSCLAARTLLPTASRMARSTALLSRVSRSVMPDSGASFSARRLRCSVSMNGPAHMIRARSSTFRSSRTLPGHS